MLKSRALLPLLVSPTLGAACSVFEPTITEPGLIIFYEDTAQITMPDAATRATRFDVSIQTFGGGCTREVARTEIEIIGALAVIRPYNQTQRANACPDDLRLLTHTAALQFDQPGLATVRVVAEQRPFEGDGTRTGPAQLEWQIVVQ